MSTTTTPQLQKGDRVLGHDPEKPRPTRLVVSGEPWFNDADGQWYYPISDPETGEDGDMTDADLNDGTVEKVRDYEMPSRPEGFEKIPKKWQRYVENVEMNLRHEREERTAGIAETDTIADPFADAPTPLPNGSSVEFFLGDDRESDWQAHIKCRTSVDHRGRHWLEVHGGDTIEVRPQSSNVCRVGVLAKGDR